MNIAVQIPQRRLYLNNWAILTAENDVRWHFGDIDETKMLQTVDFVNALSKLGAEIWGEGIGMIRLRYPRPHPSQADDIMIVNLQDKYNIVISDPLVTTRLIKKIEIEDDPIPHLDDMRSILAGTASVIYAHFYSQEEIIDRSVVDSLFQESVKAVTFNENVSVGNGECSFSAMSIEELLFFHALLKELFERYISTTLPGEPWGIIHSNSGAHIYMDYNSPVDAALISAFSSVVVTYCRLLFQAYPARLVFGSHSISGMDFITTDQNSFVINNPRKLLSFQKVVRKWRKVPKSIITDLAPAMQDYFAELTLIEQKQKFKSLELHQVINRLTHMGIRRARGYKMS